MALEKKLGKKWNQRGVAGNLSVGNKLGKRSHRGLGLEDCKKE